MSRYSNDIALRHKDKQRVTQVRRQKLEETLETQNLREQAEKANDETYLKIRETIKSVEDLRLLLQQKQLLIYADLSALKEREQNLLRRLSGLSSVELISEALRNEITEFNRLYSEYESNFTEKAPQAQRELTKKQRQFKENLQLVQMEISSTQRLIEELLRSPTLQTFFGVSLNLYGSQLDKFATVLRRLNPDTDNLQTSLYLIENIKRLVRRARSRCDSYRDISRSLDPDTDTPETFLYAEPYYYRFPDDRVPKRILDRMKVVSDPAKH